MIGRRHTLLFLAGAAVFAILSRSATAPAVIRVPRTLRTPSGLVAPRRVPAPAPESPALQTLRATSAGDPWTGLVDAAAVYRVGEYPEYSPDPETAARCLRCVILRCPDEATKNRARAAMFGDPPETCDDSPESRELPKRFADLLLARANAEAVTAVTTITHVPTPATPPAIRTVHADAQNTHDSGVTVSMRTRLRGLPEGSRDRSEDIQTAILNAGMSPEDTENAMHVMLSLSGNMHSGLDVTELEAASKVLARFDELGADTEVFARQLASAVENGTVVCSTGKIARILGSLDGIDASNALKPTWIVREELMGLAAKIRDSGGSADQFKTEATATYTDLGFSPGLVSAWTDEISAGFE